MARARSRGSREAEFVSQNQHSHSSDDIPRFEAWLGVLATSLLPAGAALFLPHAFAIPLIACTVLLFTVGLVMLSVQSRRSAHRERELEPSRHPPDSPAHTPAAVEAE